MSHGEHLFEKQGKAEKLKVIEFERKTERITKGLVRRWSAKRCR